MRGDPKWSRKEAKRGLLARLARLARTSLDIVCKTQVIALSRSLAPKTARRLIFDQSNRRKKASFFELEAIVAHPSSSSFLKGHRVFRQLPNVQAAPISRWAIDEASPKSFIPFSNGWITLARPAVKGEIRKEIENGICLFGSYPTNWYHWIVNILPSLYLADLDGHHHASIPILVHEKVRSGTFRQSLEAINHLQRDITFLPPKPLQINHAVIPRSPSYQVAGLRGRKKENISLLGDLELETLRAFRNELTRVTQEPHLGVVSARPRLKKLYLSRGSHGRSLQDERLIEELRDLGFLIVQPEKMNFASQIKLFSEAEVIVGATGAGFANILFAKNARIIVIQPDFLTGSVFSQIARVGKNQFLTAPSSHPAQSWTELYRSELPASVNVPDVMRKLKT